MGSRQASCRGPGQPSDVVLSGTLKTPASDLKSHHRVRVNVDARLRLLANWCLPHRFSLDWHVGANLPTHSRHSLAALEVAPLCALRSAPRNKHATRSRRCPCTHVARASGFRNYRAKTRKNQTPRERGLTPLESKGVSQVLARRQYGLHLMLMGDAVAKMRPHFC